MIFHFYIKEYKSQTIKLKKQQQQQQSHDKHQHSSFFFMRNAKSPAGLSEAWTLKLKILLVIYWWCFYSESTTFIQQEKCLVTSIVFIVLIITDVVFNSAAPFGNKAVSGFIRTYMENHYRRGFSKTKETLETVIFSSLFPFSFYE